MNKTHDLNARKPLRLWPGVVLAIVVVVARYIVPELAPEAEVFEMPLTILGFMVGVIAALAILLWWLFLSRAAWSERIAAIVLFVAAEFALRPIVHESIRTGNMGYMLIFYSVPILCLALVVWAVATHRLPDPIRRAALPLAIVLACVPFVIIRTAGVAGTGAQLHWRWTPTPEERLLAQGVDEPQAAPAPPPPSETAAEPPAAKPVEKPAAPVQTPPPAKPRPAKTEPAAAPPIERRAEWPGFRGPERDSIIRGLRINTDWSASPPVEIWRRPIGPGWSSFAVRGDLFYTQEQRGEDEIVACYRMATGEPVWRHRDPVRFWESNAGAGPRGTPTLGGGRVYAFGATGIVNALDADTGKKLWSRNAAADTGVKIPDWGFASSPLVIDDMVVVAAAGQLIAYDARTGEQRWMGPKGGAGYSSPHLVTIDGVPQIMLLRGSRTISVSPADGKLLWEHVWAVGVGIVQPAVAQNGDILIATGDTMGGVGIRRLGVSKGPAGWKVEERWTTRGLKPYFNDYVVHEGHAYGFDGSILSCIDLQDGARKWKGGRYGSGQLVLLADQDLMLVISEEGELALVKAAPDQFTEVARFKAMDAKTWNHPVVVRDVLLIRNGEEMVAFRLARGAQQTN